MLAPPIGFEPKVQVIRTNLKAGGPHLDKRGRLSDFPEDLRIRQQP